MSNLLALAMLGLLGVLVLDGLRAREQALLLCRRACQARGLQLLDSTVALHRMAPSWQGQGLRLRRVYRFEFSEEGEERRSGYVVLRGRALEEVSFGLPSRIEDA